MMEHQLISTDLEHQGVDLVSIEIKDSELIYHLNGHVEVRSLVNSYPHDIFVEASPIEDAALEIRFRGSGE